MDHLEQCWAPHLLLHCSSARQRRELHVAPKERRKTRTRSSPRAGFGILQLRRSTRCYAHQHAHSRCHSSPPLGLSSIPLCALCLTSLVPPSTAVYDRSQACCHVIHAPCLTGACGHTTGSNGGKTSSSMKPQPTSHSPFDDITRLTEGERDVPALVGTLPTSPRSFFRPCAWCLNGIQSTHKSEEQEASQNRLYHFVCTRYKPITEDYHSPHILPHSRDLRLRDNRERGMNTDLGRIISIWGPL